MAEWTGNDIERLCVLWATGLSESLIGARLGRSKNAVNGKAKRIGLPARPSPIKPRQGPRQPKPLRGQKHTLPPLPSLMS